MKNFMLNWKLPKKTIETSEPTITNLSNLTTKNMTNMTLSRKNGNIFTRKTKNLLTNSPPVENHCTKSKKPRRRPKLNTMR